MGLVTIETKLEFQWQKLFFNPIWYWPYDLEVYISLNIVILGLSILNEKKLVG